MIRALKDSLMPVLLVLALIVSACNSSHKHQEGEAVEYTCPMHPQVIKDEPGKCPICGMDLVPKSHTSTGFTLNDSLKQLVKPVNEIVISDIKTVLPQKGFRFSDLSVKGRINYNSNNWNSISSRVSGRIERLFVKYNYQQVSKGQKIMEIYSPDLVSAQQEMLYLSKNSEPTLLDAAKRKLRLFGVSDQQINQVLRSGKVQYSFAVYSPYSGYVAELPKASSSSSGSPMATQGSTVIESSANSGGSMAAMGSSSSASTPALPAIEQNAPLQITEGQYVSAGQTIFSLINPSSLWAEFFVSPDKLDQFKRGAMVRVESIDAPVHSDNVEVELVQPYYSEGTQFSLVRARVRNAGNWRVGQLINVSSESAKRNGVWLPRRAVLQLGLKYVAFIKRSGVFEPVYVTVSDRVGDWANIGGSIDPATPVAENAWFLVDTESFIKPTALE